MTSKVFPDYEHFTNHELAAGIWAASFQANMKLLHEEVQRA